MKAVVYDNELKLVDNWEKPTPKKGEVLIKTKMVGICNTDYEITKGYMGYKGVLGHEFTGVVEAVGEDVNSSWTGKRVVGEINCACNIAGCEMCGKGLVRHCFNRQTLGIWQKDGCFSEYFTLPEENLVIIPDNVSDEEAVFVEPVAAAVEILEQLHIKPYDKVAVLGDGKLGLCISLVLSAHNIDFVHIGKHQDKLDISKAAGAKTMLLQDLKPDKSYDVVVEATGSVGGFETSLSLTKPRGVLVLKSTIAAKEGLNLSSVVVDEITILGSRCGQFSPAMRLFERGAIDVKPLISCVLPIDKALEGFEKNKQSDVLKVLLQLY